MAESKECHRCKSTMTYISGVIRSIYQCNACGATIVDSEIDFSKVTIDLDEAPASDDSHWTFY